jgi:hypothetical protein
VPQEDARGQGEDEGEGTEYLGQPPVRMRGVPLVEQFVEDLGDPVVDRVAETGQELLAGLDAEDLGAGPGRAGGVAAIARPEAGVDQWPAPCRLACGWLASDASFRVLRGSPDRLAAGMAGCAVPGTATRLP